MEPKTQNNTVRSLLLFVIIGVLLLAVIILGVRWARGRSDQIATANQPAVQQPQEQKQPEPQPTPAATPQPQTAPTANKSVSNPISSSTPSHVPATGMEDAILSIIVLAATVFAATTYAQSRRRLVQLK